MITLLFCGSNLNELCKYTVRPRGVILTRLVKMLTRRVILIHLTQTLRPCLYPFIDVTSGHDLANEITLNIAWSCQIIFNAISFAR